VKRLERIRRIKALQKEVVRTTETRSLIEAPYRNDALMQDLVDTCLPSTLLWVAADLTIDSELIHTRRISQWKKKMPSLHKRPVIFLLGV
jgi:16S rRNA (cytidine1402-2'-O)-methyltransferase